MSVHELPVQRQAAYWARRILANEMKLEPMRLAEAQLIATEVVAHFVSPSDALDTSPEHSLEVTIIPGPAEWRVEVAGREDVELQLDQLTTMLIDSLSRRWGDTSTEGRRVIWFEIKAPGTGVVLTDLEPSELLQRAVGDPRYQEEVVRRYGPFSAAIARRFRGKGVADADLEQVALLGLVSAVHRYQVEKGDFEPFAAVTIAGELKRYLRDRAWSVRVPRSLQESTLNVGKAADRLTQKLGRQPDADEIAADLGITRQAVLEALRARVAYRWESIDAPDPTTGVNTADLLADPDENMISIWPELAEEMALLPAREQEIVYLRFFEDLTQSEIADRIGISQMHVSRLLARALTRLRTVVSEEIGT